MRLFVAVTPPEHVLDRLETATARVREEWTGLRWSGRAQWHITLAFYGELDAARLPALTRRLARAAGRSAPLDLELGGAGTFPGADRARVLWAGVRGDVRGLRRLADAAAAAGRRAGAPADRKPFRPHLTLARCRAPTDLRPALAGIDGFAAGTWRAEGFELIRSHPGRAPRYETLGDWPLDGSAQ